jgi:hypothetical protein
MADQKTIYKLMCDANEGMGLRAQPEALSHLAKHLAEALDTSRQIKTKRESIILTLKSAKKQVEAFEQELLDLQDVCPHLNSRGYHTAETEVTYHCEDCQKELDE